MLACAVSLDLDKVSGREDRSHERQVENIRAVIAGRHHADCHRHAGFTRPVALDKVCRTREIVIGEVDRELLPVGYPGRHLHGKIGLILSREHLVCNFIQHLCNLCWRGSGSRRRQYPCQFHR